MLIVHERWSFYTHSNITHTKCSVNEKEKKEVSILLPLNILQHNMKHEIVHMLNLMQ